MVQVESDNTSEVPVVRNQACQGSIELLVLGSESVFRECLQEVLKVKHLTKCRNGIIDHWVKNLCVVVKTKLESSKLLHEVDLTQEVDMGKSNLNKERMIAKFTAGTPEA